MQLSERKVIFRDFCCAQGFVGALLTQGRGFQRGGEYFSSDTVGIGSRGLLGANGELPWCLERGEKGTDTGMASSFCWGKTVVILVCLACISFLVLEKDLLAVASA